jgi:hypothetical protein
VLREISEVGMEVDGRMVGLKCVYVLAGIHWNSLLYGYDINMTQGNSGAVELLRRVVALELGGLVSRRLTKIVETNSITVHSTQE